MQCTTICLEINTRYCTTPAILMHVQYFKYNFLTTFTVQICNCPRIYKPVMYLEVVKNFTVWLIHYQLNSQTNSNEPFRRDVCISVNFYTKKHGRLFINSLLLTIFSISSLIHLNTIRYSGYAWVSLKMTKIVGAAGLSTTESYLATVLFGFRGGTMYDWLPTANSPVNTRDW